MDQHTNRSQEPVTTAAKEEGKDGNTDAYGEYGAAKLDFDPLKDLNLPSSYDEVTSRFRRLQGDRSASLLN
ncbi:MAG: hypothetical protein R2817_00170 [Flavobacteriales bacterium]